MKKFVCTLALLFAGSANAGIITVGGSSLTGADQVFGFEAGKAAYSWEVLNTQFVGEGLTVSSNIDNSILLYGAGACLPGSFSYSGSNYIGVGIYDNCYVDQGQTTATFTFDDVVSEASFDWYAHGANYTFTIQALLNDVVVSSAGIAGNGSTVNISLAGSDFDQIRFIESSLQSWFWMDQLAVNYAEVSGSVPASAPATLALFGLGLAGIGFSRKKKAA
ncbi:PEP-CTERM sorting domain-containing protein [Alteromonas sp. AMM-1]|uniref:PEP-CTERM sorting domain-containing protein n=1 Tax=Alteromonas sp. AMM-1 TaxID=3394233 RepID=UPI0039A4005F